MARPLGQFERRKVHLLKVLRQDVGARTLQDQQLADLLSLGVRQTKRVLSALRKDGIIATSVRRYRAPALGTWWTRRTITIIEE